MEGVFEGRNILCSDRFFYTGRNQSRRLFVALRLIFSDV
ncbi:Uncharacterized protein dnm_010310 [Desulfonema magnum]|uniref:Uncharacterized protein n=1 Tax=Desulfonema magnum TaxID=45655 RepID=A0A975BGD7_9BACT|nr:Uncharacterized protein dnm_010310 [Desulfonema magnum]